jgi:hypothetical protein
MLTGPILLRTRPHNKVRIDELSKLTNIVPVSAHHDYRALASFWCKTRWTSIMTLKFEQILGNLALNLRLWMCKFEFRTKN